MNEKKTSDRQDKPYAAKTGRKSGRSKRDFRSHKKVDASDKEVKTQGYKSRDNDVSWYTKNMQNVRDVASLSYNAAVGSSFTLNHDGEGTASYTSNLPGVLSLYNMPVVGVAAGSADSTSPVNIAMRNLYSKVRRANSGAKVYESSDLMMYLMAMDSVYTFHAWMVRLYGLLNAVSVFNRYVPNGLIATQRVNFNDLLAGMSDFRAYINLFANRVNAFVVPNNMPIFVRHSWMYSNVYKDEDVRKAQFYLYTPAFLNLYEIDSVTGAGKLTPYPITCQWDATNGIAPKSIMGLASIRAMGEALIAPLLKMEDFAFMSGDLLKAFGENNVFRLAQIGEDYVTLPTFSEEVLGQIHNTEFTGVNPVTVTPEGETKGLGSLCTTQITSVGGGELVFMPYFADARHLAFDKIIDSWKDNPSDEDTVVFSRNKITATLLQPSAGSDLGPLAKLTSCGSDICFFAGMIYNNASNTPSLSIHYAKDTTSGLNGSFRLMKFNELPISLVWSDTSFGIVNPGDYFGELSNYTIASVQTMKNIHAAALMSLFDVPMNW